MHDQESMASIGTESGWEVDADLARRSEGLAPKGERFEGSLRDIGIEETPGGFFVAGHVNDGIAAKRVACHARVTGIEVPMFMPIDHRYELVFNSGLKREFEVGVPPFGSFESCQRNARRESIDPMLEEDLVSTTVIEEVGALIVDNGAGVGI